MSAAPNNQKSKNDDEKEEHPNESKTIQCVYPWDSMKLNYIKFENIAAYAWC